MVAVSLVARVPSVRGLHPIFLSHHPLIALIVIVVIVCVVMAARSARR